MTPATVYPPALRREIRRAARLSSVLTVRAINAQVSDWCCGRADEVRAVVGDATREWSEGRLDEVRAADRIGSYVRGVEEALQAWVRSTRGPGSAPLTRPPNDTIADG